MRVLVLSDSHSSLRFMWDMIRRLCPDAIIHLGDHYSDAQSIAEENPDTAVLAVPGNCDMFRAYGAPEVLCTELFGARLYMTHGHRHGVKQTLVRLIRDAREAGAQAALFGHTHSPVIAQEDGLWIINPGASGSSTATGALLEILDGKVVDCRQVSWMPFTE